MMRSTGRMAYQASRRLATRRLTNRSLSTTGGLENFTPSPPEELTPEMAEGIGDMTQFYIRYGLSNQQLRALHKEDMPITQKWHKMMEIFLTTQLHVVAGLGYSADEAGLTKYANDLNKVIQESDETIRELFQETRRDSWREVVATAFGLDVQEIPTLSIVDARNMMHKVSSKMMHPDVLNEVKSRTRFIEDPDPEKEITLKHQVLQDVIVNEVYLGGSPSLVEEGGMGSGPKGYAKLQCALSDFEGDPLMSQYASTAMMKIWEAAGLDINSIEGPGLSG